MTDNEQRRFWRTLPGIITATAGLISAVAALFGGFAAAGIIGASQPAGSPTGASPDTSSTRPSGGATPGGVIPSSGSSANGTISGGGNGPGGGATPADAIPVGTSAHGTTPGGRASPGVSNPKGSNNSAGMTVDQANAVAWMGGAVNIQPTSQTSQVFVPSLPRLMAVEVALDTLNAGQGGETVSLRILNGSGQEIAAVPATIAEGFDGFWRFYLPGGGLAVTPGEPLTMMLQDSGKTVFAWKYVGGNPYPRGQSYLYGSPFGTNDFLFRTYGSQA